MVLVQKWPFFQLIFFLGNKGQQNLVYHILGPKNNFLGLIEIFLKGLVHGFISKLAIFPTFFR